VTQKEVEYCLSPRNKKIFDSFKRKEKEGDELNIQKLYQVGNYI